MCGHCANSSVETLYNQFWFKNKKLLKEKYCAQPFTLATVSKWKVGGGRNFQSVSAFRSLSFHFHVYNARILQNNLTALKDHTAEIGGESLKNPQ